MLRFKTGSFSLTLLVGLEVEHFISNSLLCRGVVLWDASFMGWGPLFDPSS